MTGALVERVSVVASGSGLRHWDGHELADVAEAAAAVLGLAGTILPPTRIYGATVMPVVAWHLNVLAERQRAGHGPILVRARLRDMLAEPDPGDPAEALHPSGFLAVGTAKASRAGMTALTSYAAVAAVVPAPPGLTEWEELVSGYYGFSIVEYTRDGARVTVDGGGRDTRARPVVHQARLLSEQLFDVAVRYGRVPPL